MGRLIMLQLYGTPLSYPTNKIRYLANYLEIPFEFHIINLLEGEQQKPKFLAINAFGKVPAIDDNGFKLAESNAILRYLAAKYASPLYPNDLKQRAIVEQWMDFVSLHISSAISKISYNTFIYKFRNDTKDERSLQDGYKFLGMYLPNVETQLAQNTYLTGNSISIADLALLACLDPCDILDITLDKYPHLNKWRNKLMQEAFYTSCFEKSYAETFKKVITHREAATTK